MSPQGGGFALGWEDLGLSGKRTPVADGIWYLGPGYSPHQIAQKEPENINAADTTNTDQLWSGGGLGLNLTGAGLTVGIWDQGGVRTTHNELVGRVTLVDNVPLVDHSTHVAGTIGASGVVANAKGMASQVKILSYDWDNDFNEMRAAASSIVASNHSYAAITGWTTLTTGPSTPPYPNVGFTDVWYDDRAVDTEDPKFGKYDTSAAQLDDVIADNPSLLSVWAAGNDRDDAFGNFHFDQTYVTYLSNGASGPGWYQVSTSVYPAPPSDGAAGGYDTLPPTQTAKNSIVVGAVNDINVDPYTNANVLLAGFSSYGPTDDGRIKPDLVANGTSVFSSVAGTNGSYITMSGTSMAAPNVTGTAVLLAQHYQNLFGSLPAAATQKALMIQTAFDAGNPGPDYANGWGLLDAAAAANLLTAAAGPNPTASVLNRSYAGTEQTYQFTSTGGANNPLKATIAWTDPAGVAQGAGLDLSTSVLVNDLDIWVTGPGGTYYPWNLNPSNPSAAAFQTSANHRDNVEQVLVSAPTAGTYTLHVGRTGATFNQDFALIVSGGALDTALPTVDIVDITPDPRNSAVAAVTIQFSDAVTGFDLADLSLTRNGGANLLTGAQTLTTGNNISFTLNNLAGLTGTAGNYVLTLNAVGSGIQDLSSNLLISGASDAWTVDTSVPTADIVDVTPDPRGSGVGSIQIAFSEAVSGFDLADLSLARNGGANLLTGSQTLTTSDNITYTLNNLAGVTGTSGNYLLTLTAASSGIADTAGNLLAANASDAWVVDTSTPTVDITDVTPDPRNTAVSSLQIVFNKLVSGFDLADLSLTRNGGGNLLTASQTLTTVDNIVYTLNNLSSLTGTSGSYLLTLTAAGSGIVDALANPLASGATDAWVVDVTPPTADVVDVTPDPRQTSVPSIQIVFSEAVNGFDLADLALTLNGGPNLLTGGQTLTTSDNITFTLNNLAGLTGQPGTYQLTLNGTGAGIADLLGNAFTGSASDGWFMSLTEIQAEDFTRRTAGNGHQWSIVDQEVAGVGSFTGATGPSADFLQALTLAGQDSPQGNISGPAAPSLEYDVTITTPGIYNLKVRVAGISSASDSLWVDSTTGSLSDPQGNETVGSALKVETGATAVFQTRDAGRWLLSAGLHTFRISMRESGAAIDSLQLIAPTSTSISGPTEIQAENYSNRQDGGSHRWWVADLETPGAGVFTGATGPSQDYVQALNLSGQDTPFGNLSPAAPYIDYTIEVPTTGAYSLQVRTAGLSSASDSLWASIPTGTLQDGQGNTLTSGALQINTNSSGAFELRNAGVWLLSAGTHTIRLQMRESGAAVDSLLLTPVAAVPIIGTTEIQAENFARRQSGNNHQWAIIDLENAGAGSFSGATGSGQDFLQSLSLAYQDTSVANLAPAAPSIEYDIQVSAAGIYDLKLRVAGLSGNSDSLWVEIPSGTLNNAQGNATSGSALNIGTGGTGVFQLRDAGRWNLTPGVHTVRISMRESGAAIDSLQVIAPSVPTPIVGLTEIQAETFSRRQAGNGHQWSIVDQETAGAGTFTGATGPASDYVQSLTTSGQDSTLGILAPGTPSVEYDIQVSSAGTYELKLRVAGLNLSSDSLWVEVPTGTLSDAQGNAVTGGGLKIETNSSGAFTLKSAGRWNLSAGVHTIRISMRESGAAVDSLQIGQVSAALGASQELSGGPAIALAPAEASLRAAAADTTRPSMAIVPVSPDPRATPVDEIEIVFSEPVTGFQLKDLNLDRANDGAGNLLTSAQTLTTSDNRTWTLGNLAPVTAFGGQYWLSLFGNHGVADLAGNALASSTAESWSKTIVDAVPPTVDIVDVSPDPRGAPVSQVTLVFSEPVTGFDLADLSLDRAFDGLGNLLTAGQTLTTSDNITWTLGNLSGVTEQTGQYVLSVLTSGGIRDAGGNLLATSAADIWVKTGGDLTPPSVVDLVDVAPDPRTTPVNDISIVFSEPVSGFDLSDLNLDRAYDGLGNLLTGAQTLITSDHVTWTLGNLAPLNTHEGLYVLSFKGGSLGIVDGAGNVLAGALPSERWRVTADLTPPTGDIVNVSPDPRPTAVDSLAIVFSKAVAGLQKSDFILDRAFDGLGSLIGAAQTLTTSDNITWTLGNLGPITGLDGAYTIYIRSDAGITDLLGNPLSNSVSEQWTKNASLSSADGGVLKAVDAALQDWRA